MQSQAVLLTEAACTVRDISGPFLRFACGELLRCRSLAEHVLFFVFFTNKLNSLQRGQLQPRNTRYP